MGNCLFCEKSLEKRPPNDCDGQLSHWAFYAKYLEKKVKELKQELNQYNIDFHKI